jgi:hypothetical protein
MTKQMICRMDVLDSITRKAVKYSVICAERKGSHLLIKFRNPYYNNEKLNFIWVEH